MAISTNSPEKTTTEQQNPTQPPAPDNPDLPDSSAAPPSAIPATATATVVAVNPSLNNSQPTAPQPTGIAPPPQIQPYVPLSQVSTVPPSFRPATLPVPLPTAPQFSPIPNPNFQNHGVQGLGQVQPPGVMMPPPSQSSGAMPSVPQMMPPQYGQPGQQPMRMYAPMPNGYQMAMPQGTMNPPVSY